MSVVVERLIQMIDESKISEVDIQQVVAAKGHYQETEPVTDYSDDFITRYLFLIRTYETT